MQLSHNPQSATLILRDAGVHIWGFDHQLGGTRRSLNELKVAGLLCNDVNEIARQGYEFNRGVSTDEDLSSLAKTPLKRLLERCPRPQAFLFHHSYSVNVSPLATDSSKEGFMPHAQYFPAVLLREFDIDDVPFLTLFASGCTGLFSLITAAGSFAAFGRRDPVLCITADVKPQNSTYDALREKILTSDCASGFLIGHENRGYQILGLSLYSTKRQSVQLLEIVKRAVQMSQELMNVLGVDRAREKLVVHYPNIFPTAWHMVTNYLNASSEPQIFDGIGDRAHCLSSDPVISLANRHRSEAGRLHLVVNFGSGLNLAVGLFKEVG